MADSTCCSGKLTVMIREFNGPDLDKISWKIQHFQKEIEGITGKIPEVKWEASLDRPMET